MISRDRTNINIPVTLNSQECLDNLNDLIELITTYIKDNIKAGKKMISSTYYRGNLPDQNDPTILIQDVADALTTLYEEKCAFCESKRHKPDVEHFRPKKNVTGVKNQIGYYWLCYEWTNLIPCCSDCNDIKHTAFPISNEDNRVFAPIFNINGTIDFTTNGFSNNPLFLEGAMILHPEYDQNVEEAFEFNNLAEIKGVDPEGKGEVTREKVGLNRDDLLYFRQQVIDEYKDYCELALSVNNHQNFIDILSKLRNRALDTSAEYTLLCRFIYNNFDEIVIPLMVPPAQHIAETLYHQNYNAI